jgi:hypothetical protein
MLAWIRTRLGTLVHDPSRRLQRANVGNGGPEIGNFLVTENRGRRTEDRALAL